MRLNIVHSNQVDEECLKLRHLSSLSMDNEFQARGRKENADHPWESDPHTPHLGVLSFERSKLAIFKTEWLKKNTYTYIHMQPPIMLNTAITPNPVSKWEL